MNKLNVLVGGMSALVSMAAVGCSSSDGDGRIDSSVNESAVASDLTPEETQEVCSAAADYFAMKFPAAELCKAAGLSAYITAGIAGEDPVEGCQAAVDSCIEDDEAPQISCVEEDETVSSDCSATVGELETCLADTIDRQAEAWEGLGLPDCDGVEDFLKTADQASFQDAVDIQPSDIESCAKLDDACFDDDEEE